MLSAGRSPDMKQFLVNLLIAVALGLCGLCTYQWYRESRLRTEMEGQSRELYRKKDTINGLNTALQQTREDAERLDKLNVRLNGEIKTNALEIAGLRRQVDQLTQETNRLSGDLATYKNSLEVANANTAEANKAVQTQNQTIKQLVDERTGLVEKYKEVVKQYEDLVKQFEAYQADVKKAMESQQPKKN